MTNQDPESIVNGVAKAYGEFLNLSRSGKWDDRPQHVLQRGIEKAMTKWLNDNRADVLKAMAEAAQGGTVDTRPVKWDPISEVFRDADGNEIGPEQDGAR